MKPRPTNSFVWFQKCEIKNVDKIKNVKKVYYIYVSDATS